VALGGGWWNSPPNNAGTVGGQEGNGRTRTK
jgi:hypothetical protein